MSQYILIKVTSHNFQVKKKNDLKHFIMWCDIEDSMPKQYFV